MESSLWDKLPQAEGSSSLGRTWGPAVAASNQEKPSAAETHVKWTTCCSCVPWMTPASLRRGPRVKHQALPTAGHVKLGYTSPPFSPHHRTRRKFPLQRKKLRLGEVTADRHAAHGGEEFPTCKVSLSAAISRPWEDRTGTLGMAEGGPRTSTQGLAGVLGHLLSPAVSGTPQP